jgi:hypothetical protein
LAVVQSYRMISFKFYLLFAFTAIAHGFNGKYATLPSLREQAALQDAWTKSRIESIPALLNKHGVDAWLVSSIITPIKHLNPKNMLNLLQVSQREYAEDTVFWSLKHSTQFSARRRTLQLFLANNTASSNKAYTWIDNTPNLWTEVLAVLVANKPSKIAVNINAELAFSSGLHAGEFELIKKELGQEWVDRLVDLPVLAIEFVGTMPEAQFEWYRKLQGTAWAMISEAFSNKVISPGETNTDVSILRYPHIQRHSEHDCCS